MRPGEIIEFLMQRKLLDRADIMEMSLKELQLMLDYLSGVRPEAAPRDRLGRPAVRSAAAPTEGSRQSGRPSA